MAGLSVSDVLFAGLRGRKPEEAPRPENPLFDHAFYGANNPHVVKGGIDLHVHYSYFGCRNGYDPNPYFSSGWYWAQNPDVAATGANPLDHYLDSGAVEGRNPSPAFSTWLYLMLYPDVRASGMNPLLHFLQCGKAEGRLAPPVCLVPSLATMQGAAPEDVPKSADAETTIGLIREWADKLAAAQRLT